MGRNKTKTGRALNPADAFRKQQRQKEIKKNKATKQKVRTLILETKSSSKIRTQIDEINAMEREGELDKKQKTKKKMLQDTLAKVIELEKLKGDNLQEEDLMSIPNYIDFTQGPIILSDKPKEKSEIKLRAPTSTTLVPPSMNNNSLPPAPSEPNPFDLPPPPSEPLPDEEEAPPLPTDDLPPLPDGPPPLATNYPYHPTPPMMANPWATRGGLPGAYMMPPPLHPSPAMRGAPFPYPPNQAMGMQPPPMQFMQAQQQQQQYMMQQQQLQAQSQQTPQQSYPPQKQQTNLPSATTASTTASSSTIQTNAGKFLAKPSALKVKRVQSVTAVPIKKIRVDVAAASLVATTATVPSAQTLAKKEEEELEQDFEQYMSEIAALGVL